MPLVTPTTPNLPDYLTFLGEGGVVGIPAVNLPPGFTGTGTVDGTTEDLVVATVLTGSVEIGASVYDANGLIPVSVTVTKQISGSAGGPGVYLMSGVSTGAAAGEAIGAYNDTVVMSFQVAKDIVNLALNCGSPRIYTLAVYNLAADRLINFALDIPDQTYFKDLRCRLRVEDRTPGVVSSTSDEGTSSSYLNPEFMETLTLQDLQTLKTPYGRQYMAFAQMYGRTIWGLT